jgi:conjugative relaxase-like TrwC/TraI family protein
VTKVFRLVPLAAWPASGRTLLGATIHTVHAGNGWRYYLVETAVHDEKRSMRTGLTGYYLDSGNPPGRWEEYRAKALSVDGRIVAEDQMHHLFQLGYHPDDGTPLGQKFPVFRSVDQRVAERLARESGADGDRRDAIREEEQCKGEREAVAGYDLTFAPVKSVSVLWGIADDATRQVIESCHDDARKDALGWLIDQAVYTRRGRAGIAHAAVDSVTTAVFMHRTSRMGDPHLHTHVLMSNKVRTADDGAWRSIHGDLIFKAAVAMSERYNSRIEALISERLGVSFVETSRDIREIDGIPTDVLRRFASRRVQVEARTTELLNEYRRKHGREPDHETEYRLAQQATLETRPAKKDGTTAASERDEWRDTITEATGESPNALLARVTARPTPSPHAEGHEPGAGELVDRVLSKVQERRAQWTVMHLRAETERVIRRLDQPAARQAAFVDDVVDQVLADQRVIALTPPSFVDEPGELRLPNGDPIWRTATTHKYTTTAILEAEAALADAARMRTGPVVDEVSEAVILLQLAAEGHELAADQADAVSRLGRSGAVVDLLVAPAGAGKSHTMRAMAAVWSATTGRVIGLAPTARAARELADAAHLYEIGVEAQTIHKWLLHTDRDDCSLRAGDLVIVDEAGMAATPQLDALRRQVLDAGAKLLLVGDHRQLAAVGAGGALRHLYHDVGATELTSLWRFSDPWEALATTRLREGDHTVIDEYLERRRVRTGPASRLIEDLYQAWHTDITAGRTSVMLAVANRTVAQLNQRARNDRVATGVVDADGIVLIDGTTAGAGDTIVTRHNRSDLRVLGGKDWVHNGDLWTIDTVHGDGTLTVTHNGHDGRLRLPAEYVADHVELGYASTIARAQGITVDTARVLVDSTAMDRANLYVALTRGRHLNHVSLATRDEVDTTMDRPTRPDRDARQMLATILDHDGDLSATEQLQAEQDTEWGLPTLAARYEHVIAQLNAARLRELVLLVVDRPNAEAILASDGWDALQAQLRRIEHHGHDPAEVLQAAYDARSLADAVDIAAVLHHRIERRLGADATGGTYLGLSPAPTTPGDLGDWARRIHTHITDQLATAVPVDLTEPWADTLRAQLVQDPLLDRIATWRTLHGIIDADQALGPDPARYRATVDHRDHLAAELETALDDVRLAHGRHLDDLLHADHLPRWTAWLGQPPRNDKAKRTAWYESVAHIATWRDVSGVIDPATAWPERNDPPGAIDQAIRDARSASIDVRSKLAAAHRTAASSTRHAADPGNTHRDDLTR